MMLPDLRHADAPASCSRGGRSDQVDAGSPLSLPDAPDVRTDGAPTSGTVVTATGRVLRFDLAGMTEDACASWLAVYELGARDGWARGYQAAEDDAAEVHRRAHAVVQAAARAIPFDVLCDRRGEHRRAERQRAILAERGIVA